MKFKHIQQKISKSKQDKEKAVLYCELAHFHHTLGNDDQEQTSLEEALKMDSSSIRARRNLVLSYMDAADAAKAREICERFSSDVSTSFSWTRALLEHLSFYVLQEKDSSEITANEVLSKAMKSNPFVAVVLCFSEEFLGNLNSEQIDLVLENWRRDCVEKKKEMKKLERQAAEAFEYCMTGVSCWLDAPQGIDRVMEHVVGNTSEIMKKLMLKCTEALRKEKSDEAKCLRLYLNGLRSVMREIDSEEEEEEEEGEEKLEVLPPKKKKKNMKQRDRRARSGYKRSRNRKKCVYGGNSNDLAVYID